MVVVVVVVRADSFSGGLSVCGGWLGGLLLGGLTGRRLEALHAQDDISHCVPPATRQRHRRSPTPAFRPRRKLNKVGRELDFKRVSRYAHASLLGTRYDGSSDDKVDFLSIVPRVHPTQSCRAEQLH